jgi:catechol 2,3-dioxygenase-like lactoylglutathione lyase family enzyme
MRLLHVGITASSEDRADEFYVDLLGLQKDEPKVLAAEICRALFGVDCDLTIINYLGQSAHFEVFVCDASTTPVGAIAHACIEVEDLSEFLEKCNRLDIEVIRVPKGNSLITFIKDADGNRFEIKQQP